MIEDERKLLNIRWDHMTKEIAFKLADVDALVRAHIKNEKDIHKLRNLLALIRGYEVECGRILQALESLN